MLTSNEKWETPWFVSNSCNCRVCVDVWKKNPVSLTKFSLGPYFYLGLVVRVRRVSCRIENGRGSFNGRPQAGNVIESRVSHQLQVDQHWGWGGCKGCAGGNTAYTQTELCSQGIATEIR